MVKEGKDRIMISLSSKSLQSLCEIADKYEMSKSQFIQFIILDYLRKEEEKA